MTAAADPLLTVLQLSDLHVHADGRGLDGVRRACDHAVAAQVPVAALVLSGDLADAGEPAAYAALRPVVEDAAAALGARLVVAAGNHDDRAALRSHLLGSHLLGSHPPGRAPDGEPLDHAVDAGGLRIVVVDTTVPGEHHGELGAAQLAWLAAELAAPAPLGRVLVLHHPPVPSAFARMRGHDLHRPHELAAVLAGSDVRMLLCGHTHHAGGSALAGIPVWIAPSTSHRAELLSPPGTARGLPACALTRVDVYADAVVAAMEPVP